MGFIYDKRHEALKLNDCLDTWQQSARCCGPSCGDRCGIVLMNSKTSGHCRNVLFEKCRQHGGSGHAALINEFSQDSVNAHLIYGYSIQGGELRLNSMTFNMDQMPDVMKDVLPKVSKATRDGQMATYKIPFQR